MKTTLLSFLLFGLLVLFKTTLFAQAPAWQWADNIGGIGNDEVNGVAVDNAGSVYITGNFSSTVFFTPTDSLVAISYDGFVARYNTDGNFIWARTITGSHHEIPQSVATDSFGNIYVAGYFNSNAGIFGTDTLTNSDGGSKAFIAKYDSTGTVKWALKVMEDTSHGTASKIDVNNKGTIIISGQYKNTIKIGGTEYPNLGQPDIYYACFNADGTFRWAGVAHSDYYDYSYQVAIDRNDNCYITGIWSGTALYLTNGISTVNNLGNPGDYDAFVAKYDSSGINKWIKCIQGSGSQVIQAVDVNANGTVFIGGACGSGAVIFFDTTYIAGSSNAQFIAKLDAQGNRLWHQTFCTSQGSPSSVIADTADNCYISGCCQIAIIGGDTISSPGIYTYYVAKTNSSGAWQWVTQGGSYVATVASELTDMMDVDNSGNCYLGNYFECGSGQTATFGGYDLTCNSPYLNFNNGFIAKLENVSTGVPEQTDPTEHSTLYPNPAEKFITIEKDIQGTMTLEFYDLTGSKIKTILVTEKTKIISISDLPNGLYIYRLTTAEGNILNKGKMLKRK